MVDLKVLKRVADNVRSAYYGHNCNEAQYIDLATDELAALRARLAELEAENKALRERRVKSNG